MGVGVTVAIDPGERHCGIAVFSESGECVHAFEMVPPDLFDFLEYSDYEITRVIVEAFRLYPDKAMAQQWSQLKTVETIGVIRFLCARKRYEMIEQPASIKKVAKRQMTARGVENWAVKNRKGGHCADAVLHGWFYFAKG